MNFHDPQRPKADMTNKPCWLGTEIPLPEPGLRPIGGSEAAQDEEWLVRIVTNELGHYEYTGLREIDLPGFFSSWRENPERTLREYFGVEPPAGRRPALMRSVNAKSLDLDF